MARQLLTSSGTWVARRLLTLSETWVARWLLTSSGTWAVSWRPSQVTLAARSRFHNISFFFRDRRSDNQPNFLIKRVLSLISFPKKDVFFNSQYFYPQLTTFDRLDPWERLIFFTALSILWVFGKALSHHVKENKVKMCWVQSLRLFLYRSVVRPCRAA